MTETQVYFLTVLEAGNPSLMFLLSSGSDENPLSGLQMAVFSLSPHKAFLWDIYASEKSEQALCVSSYKDTNPIGPGPHPYDLI